jgi:hypothetical protein
VEEGRAQRDECARRRSGSAHRRGRGREPALRPVRDRGQNRFERTTARCQSIAHPHRRPWVDEPLHDAFSLELAKTFGQDTVADSWDAGEQLVETSRCGNECFYNRPCPALSDQLDCALKGCAVVEAPSDHGEEFYALSQVSERDRPVFSTRNFWQAQPTLGVTSCEDLGNVQAAKFMSLQWS